MRSQSDAGIGVSRAPLMPDLSCQPNAGRTSQRDACLSSRLSPMVLDIAERTLVNESSIQRFRRNAMALDVSIVEVDLQDEAISALLGAMREAVSEVELAGCGCGCGCMAPP
jgi:hypothetical protein